MVVSHVGDLALAIRQRYKIARVVSHGTVALKFVRVMPQELIFRDKYGETLRKF